MLIIGRKAKESLIIDGKIEIVVSEISGDRVQLAINAPQDVVILRKELYETRRLNEEANQPADHQVLQELAQALKNKHQHKQA